MNSTELIGWAVVTRDKDENEYRFRDSGEGTGNRPRVMAKDAAKRVAQLQDGHAEREEVRIVEIHAISDG